MSVALTTYVELTIGDGLVTQFPALLVSTATGIIVTRAISEESFGEDVDEPVFGAVADLLDRRRSFCSPSLSSRGSPGTS